MSGPRCPPAAASARAEGVRHDARPLPGRPSRRLLRTSVTTRSGPRFTHHWRLVSRQFFLTVLALWYSRAAFGRCYSGATCHTAGENTLKRSNRLVLLIGVLLAVVAFVGIVLVLGQGPSTGPNPQPTIATTVQVVIAKVDIAAGTVVTDEMLDVSTLAIGAAANTFPAKGLV